jgi:hypothetical protein
MSALLFCEAVFYVPPVSIFSSVIRRKIFDSKRENFALIFG